MKKTKQDILNQFMIEVVLIDPIENIISKLENKEFRDCDIRWLNGKLHKFVNFAAKTLGVNFNNLELVNDDGNLNEFKRNTLLSAFRTILNYFKSLNFAK
jgi:hypothetical protein